MHIKRAENNIKTNFKSLSCFARPLGMFYNKNAAIPTLIIESGVTAGRTISANKKSGKIEATERFVEQGTSAVVWLWGVQAFKKIGDIIGKNVFKIPDLNFDVGYDYLRNPLENVSKGAISYKVGNILISTALATGFIGFILPKINHFITNKTLKKQNNLKNKEVATLKPATFNEYKKKTSSNISFTSLSDSAKHLAHIIENDSAKRLFITDFGVISGRFHNARNKYEKIENIFRDTSSIYFYLFSTKHIVSLLNKLTSTPNVNPKVIDATVEMLKERLENKSLNTADFLKKATGKLDSENIKKINEIFKDKKIVDTETFKEYFPDLSDKIESVSKLQPELNGKSIIAKFQAKDIILNNWASDGKFLHKLYSHVTDGKYNKKEKFVSSSEIENIRNSVDDLIHSIAKKAKDGNINIEFIEKIAKRNIAKNLFNYSIATACSIFALGILIPKVQYLIRKKLTNQDDFVGIKEYK